PDGVWMSVYSGEKWVLSKGEDQHRRGIYTFIKRTSPYPSFVSFDASSREVCMIDRIRTNTPLQALTTLNDPVYLEAGLHLAKQMQGYKDKSIRESISTGYHAVMLRKIERDKLHTLEILFEETLTQYIAQPQEAKNLL